MTIGHFNYGYLRAPWGSPEVAPFCDAVEMVNAVASRSPGFVWNAPLQEHELVPVHGLVRETNGRFDPNCLAVTLSVWNSAEALEKFVHMTVHGRFLARRDDWFIPQNAPNYVIWPISDDHRPDIGEAVGKMREFERSGGNAGAYDFKWLKARAA